jgi:hypothetical protein
MTYTALFVALSPIFVSLIRKLDWTATQTAALAVGWLLIAYIGGRYLDGALTFPPTPDLLQGFVLALTSQQAIYLLLKDTSFMAWLNAVGSVPAEAPRAQPGDQS